jgi:threonine/homoserine/homoserine lactone efflux protein
MFQSFIIFIVTFIISFLGSIHPGLVNVAVVRTTLARGLRAGLWVGVGGSLPELIYGWLAVAGVLFFEQHPQVYQWMRIAIVPLLIVMGVLTIIQKPKPPQESAVPSDGMSMSKGFLLGMVNPQLLPFWTVMVFNYQGFKYLKISSYVHQTAFVAGAALGAFGVLWVYAQIAHRNRNFIFENLSPRQLNWAIGLAMIGMGLYEWLRQVL